MADPVQTDPHRNIPASVQPLGHPTRRLRALPDAGNVQGASSLPNRDQDSRLQKEQTLEMGSRESVNRDRAVRVTVEVPAKTHSGPVGGLKRYPTPRTVVIHVG